MGMYDNLSDYEIRCPRCGMSHPGEYEIQTKDLNQMLETYTVWPSNEHPPQPGPTSEYHLASDLFSKSQIAIASPKLRYLSAGFTCNSPSCRALGRMLDYVRLGYISGFSLSWDISYSVREEDGLVLGPAKFVDPPNHYLSGIAIDFDKDDSVDLNFQNEEQVLQMFLRLIEADCKADPEVKKHWDKAMTLGLNNPFMAVIYFFGQSPRRTTWQNAKYRTWNCDHCNFELKYLPKLGLPTRCPKCGKAPEDPNVSEDDISS